MTDDVWREFFDSCAPQYMNEVFTADSRRGRGCPPGAPSPEGAT